MILHRRFLSTLKTFISFLFSIVILHQAQAQTPRRVIIEHFTNTRCSICASKNPGFYTTIHGSYPDVLHIAYHPSAPYSACVFSQQNASENDARTNFYSLYGSTPRAAVQGKAIPAVNPLVPTAAIDSTLNVFSPFELNISMSATASDSITVKAVITATDVHAYTNLNLCIAITEDTVFYNAPNGENIHYDVFRKQLFTGNGFSFSAPVNAGDSIVITGTILPNSAWMLSRINMTGMIQVPANKYIVQAARQTDIEAYSLPTAIHSNSKASGFQLFPNPASSEIYFSDDQEKSIQIYNTTGQLVMAKKSIIKILPVAALPEGLYYLRITANGTPTEIQKLIIVH